MFAAVVGVEPQTQGWAQEGLEYAFQGRRIISFTIVEQPQSFLGDWSDPPGKDLAEELFFGSEVVIDGGEVGFGLGGDMTQRGGINSALGKEAFGGIEQAIARIVSCIIHRHDL